MTLAARVRRLEQKVGSSDPIADMTDDDLEAAIAWLNAEIEAGAGMDPRVYAEHLEGRCKAGEPVDGVDDETVRLFVQALKAEGARHVAQQA